MELLRDQRSAADHGRAHGTLTADSPVSGNLSSRTFPIATKAFSDSLEALEVPHVYEVYAGDHRNRMRERMATRILPWIDARLEH